VEHARHLLRFFLFVDCLKAEVGFTHRVRPFAYSGMLRRITAAQAESYQ
jgi:hypothetical protein